MSFRKHVLPLVLLSAAAIVAVVVTRPARREDAVGLDTQRAATAHDGRNATPRDSESQALRSEILRELRAGAPAERLSERVKRYCRIESNAGAVDEVLAVYEEKLREDKLALRHREVMPPAGDEESLLHALATSEDRDVLMDAALRLATSKLTREQTDRLFNMFNSARDYRREALLTALAGTRDARFAALLETVIRDTTPSPVLRKALMYLSTRVGEDATLSASIGDRVLQLAGDRAMGIETRRQAYTVLTHMADQLRSYQDTLRSTALQSADDWERAAALRALLPSDLANRSTYVRCLNDGSIEVQDEAASGIVNCFALTGSPDALPDLYTALDRNTAQRRVIRGLLVAAGRRRGVFQQWDGLPGFIAKLDAVRASTGDDALRSDCEVLKGLLTGDR